MVDTTAYLRGEDMIYESTEKLLRTAILEYDKLAGREFLIGCGVGKNHPTECIILRINEHDFWHLLGCQIDKSKSEEIKKHNLYEMCKKGQSVRNYLVYTKDHQSCVEKSRTFLKIFHFVEKARQIRISSTGNTPDYYKFKLVHGNAYGIIGYDHDKSEKDKKIWIPKSTQSKSVGSFQKESKKIYFILSRKIHSNVFTVLEYEAVGGLYMKLKECLPKEYKINISEMSNNGSKDKTKLEMEQESKKNDGKNRPNIL